MTHHPKIRDRTTGAIMGAFIGDALGVVSNITEPQTLPQKPHQ